MRLNQCTVVVGLVKRHFLHNFVQQIFVTMAMVTCDVDCNYMILIRLRLFGWVCNYWKLGGSTTGLCNLTVQTRRNRSCVY